MAYRKKSTTKRSTYRKPAAKRRTTYKRKAAPRRASAPQTIKIVLETVPANSLVHGSGDAPLMAARQSDAPKKAKF